MMRLSTVSNYIAETCHYKHLNRLNKKHLWRGQSSANEQNKTKKKQEDLTLQQHPTRGIVKKF